MFTHKFSPSGVMLVLMGLVVLAGQFFDGMAAWVVPALAFLFIVWGLWMQAAGLLIPGGILGGIALGIWLVEQPFAQNDELLQGAAFMLAFSAGWVLITLLAGLIGERVLWPLIPGGIMALIGTGILLGGPALTALEWTGKLWPIVLVAIGLRLLWKRTDRGAQGVK